MIRLSPSPAIGIACALGWNVLCAACGPSAADIAQENALLATAQREFYEVRAESVTSERDALSAAGGAAWRAGDDLTLRLRGGQQKTYANMLEGEPSNPGHRRYRLLAYARTRRAFTIREANANGTEFLVVADDFGRESRFDAMPYFSPSGTYIVTLPARPSEGGQSVQVWRRDRDRYVPDWSGIPFRPQSGALSVSYAIDRWTKDQTVDMRARISRAPLPDAVRLFSLDRGSNWTVIDRADGGD